MAAEDWGAARTLWEEVISRDPDNVVARVELSTCVERLGDIREALRVLDSTRASSHFSSEVLFRAAYLNQKLGNNTAARDNLGLLLSNGVSRKALELARDTSEALGCYDDAIKHQETLESLGYDVKDHNSVRARLEYGQITHEHGENQSRRDALVALARRHPTYAPALDSLAEIELAQGNLDAGAEYLIKAARAEPLENNARWRKVVQLWLTCNTLDPKRRAERALAAARSAIKETRGLIRLDAELLHIETLLAVNHFQEAEKAIEAVSSLALREAGGPVPQFAHRVAILKGYCLVQTGNVHATTQLWRELAEPDSATRYADVARSNSTASQAAPSPALSTP
jgi:tetratricopeptide (TPR) repeat protein